MSFNIDISLPIFPKFFIAVSITPSGFSTILSDIKIKKISILYALVNNALMHDLTVIRRCFTPFASYFVDDGLCCRCAFALTIPTSTEVVNLKKDLVNLLKLIPFI